MKSFTVPIVLFVYARPAHLARTLASIRENLVPVLHVFSDGPRTPEAAPKVTEVRAVLRAVDWCDIRITERPTNLGLGENVRAGVSEILEKFQTCIVWEDDLVAVPGAYAWMCAALRHYATDASVFSVTGWTHPRVTPKTVEDRPYFDARAECWLWGTWARAWKGMEHEDALTKLAAARVRGVEPASYGDDLPAQARREHQSNVWAVRWLYHHFQHGGLCLRPPWSMVRHIGFDANATNAAGAETWSNPSLRGAPAVPTVWPEAHEHPDCRRLWRAAAGYTRARLKRVVRRLVPPQVRLRLKAMVGWQWFRGSYPTWPDARAASSGYGESAIVERVLNATLEVKAGSAAFERDGVVFMEPQPDAPLIAALSVVRAHLGGRLRVLDFGGALGSVYWRHRDWLQGIPDLRWDIVEQPSFVAAGRRALLDTPLRFFETIEDALRSGSYDVLLVSTVVQYLPDPAASIADWIRNAFPWILVNNVPLRRRGKDQIKAQHVPPEIYRASYPVWFFNRRSFLGHFEGSYSVESEFASEAVWPLRWRRFPSTGLLFRRRTPP